MYILSHVLRQYLLTVYLNCSFVPSWLGMGYLIELFHTVIPGLLRDFGLLWILLLRCEHAKSSSYHPEIDG